MARIKIEIDDIVCIGGEEFRVLRILPNGYCAGSVLFPSQRQFFGHADIREARAFGVLGLRSALDVPSALDVKEARLRRVECETILALIAEGAIQRTPRSVGSAMKRISRARLEFMLNDPSSGPHGVAVARPYPSAATLLKHLHSYDGSEASLLPANARRRLRDPLERFDRLVANEIRHAARTCVAPRSRPVGPAHLELCRALSRPDLAGVRLPTRGEFRRLVRRMACEAAGSPVGVPPAPLPQPGDRKWWMAA